ncbi:hypothetical protein J5U21_01706 [Saccharolobus shibatae]|uniref:Uncharacterized protein n=2 Tax=Saccharolobus shibatae TaxID=2286 RepID=A0A8F5GWI0_9CREN|nr:hypothetical protein J5U21_01706 [Saccharolobus shibatae]
MQEVFLNSNILLDSEQENYILLEFFSSNHLDLEIMELERTKRLLRKIMRKDYEIYVMVSEMDLITLNTINISNSKEFKF